MIIDCPQCGRKVSTADFDTKYNACFDCWAADVDRTFGRPGPIPWRSIVFLIIAGLAAWYCLSHFQ